MAALWALCHHPETPAVPTAATSPPRCPMRRRFSRVMRVAVAAPFLRRLAFHVRRLTRNVDQSFFIRLFVGLLGIVLVAALLVTVIEGPRTSAGEFFSTLEIGRASCRERV